MIDFDNMQLPKVDEHVITYCNTCGNQTGMHKKGRLESVMSERSYGGECIIHFPTGPDTSSIFDLSDMD